MSTEATISSAVLRGLHGEMSRLAIDAGALQRCCNLPEDNSLEDDHEIPLGSFVAALEYAADAGHSQNFGWQAGQAYDMRYLGDLGEAVGCAPTLGAALQLFADNLRLIQSSSEIIFNVDGDQLELSYRILDPDIWPRQQDAEFTLSVLCSIVRRCAGVDWQPLYIGFEHQPAVEPAARNLELGVGCAYDCAANTIVLPVRLLDTPMPGQIARDWHALFTGLNKALNEKERNQPLKSRVEREILSTLGRDDHALAKVARRLALSSRSLHRQLKAEGTSYKAILADCRARLSRLLLSNGNRPLSEVAQDLGYSDYTAFSRAFRMRFGQTPKGFRDRCSSSTGLND